VSALSALFPNGCATVSGGASGLGRATAIALADAGLPVSVLDLAAACERMEPHPGLTAIPVDVTDPALVQAAFAAHEQRTGPTRIHVSCAGVIGAGLLFTRDGGLDAEAFRRIVDVNLVGTFACARAAAEQMRRAEPNAEGARGVIVNTSSIAAYDGMIGQVAYAASKGAVAAMTLPLARELARFGIRVMSIAPGVFATPMVNNLPDQSREAVSSLLPLFPPRLGEPAEFGQLVVSIILNPLLNGEVVRLDGGLRMPPK
jgi:NAD(P)-dependent dehydrogenase (short-subunit alcohol dehydrogenase family)